jgi:hypothetical protein
MAFPTTPLSLSGLNPLSGGNEWVNVVGTAPNVPTFLPSRSTAFNMGTLPNGSSGQPGSAMAGLLGPQRGQGLADAASLLGAFSSGEKANRGLEGQFTQNHDRLMMDAQRERNTNESDAMKKLGQTSYLIGGGSQFKPPTLSIGGKTYNSPNLGFGPVAPSAAEKAGAGALQNQLQARLSPGGSYTPAPVGDYARPGTAEKIGSYGGLITGGLGALQSLGVLGGGGSAAAGGATAGAGAAAGGGIGGTLASLATNPWTIGAAGAIGGGLLLKKLLNNGPSKEELGGREVEKQFEDSFGGFHGMMNAVGQGYLASGHSAQEAQTDVKAMLDAERQGSPAVGQIIQSIMSKMGKR